MKIWLAKSTSTTTGQYPFRERRNKPAAGTAVLNKAARPVPGAKTESHPVACPLAVPTVSR